MGQRVPLQLVGEPRLELVGQVSVEDVGDLGGGVQRMQTSSGAAAGRASARPAWRRTLRQGSPRTRPGPARRRDTRRQPSRARWRSSDAAGCRGKSSTSQGRGSETNRTRGPQRADRCPRQLGVVPAMALGGEHGHLGDGRQRARGRGDVGADATRPRRSASSRETARSAGARRSPRPPIGRADIPASVARARGVVAARSAAPRALSRRQPAVLRVALPRPAVAPGPRSSAAVSKAGRWPTAGAMHRRVVDPIPSPPQSWFAATRPEQPSRTASRSA